MELRMGRKVTAGVVVLAAAALLASGQISGFQGRHRISQPFYDAKTEIQVEGAVAAVRFEPRYEGTAPFLVIELTDQKTDRRFIVEISPAWFFKHDVHQGERMKIVGSLASPGGSDPFLIAREVQFQGEAIQVRDAHGFPNWRRGARHLRHRKWSG